MGLFGRKGRGEGAEEPAARESFYEMAKRWADGKSDPAKRALLIAAAALLAAAIIASIAFGVASVTSAGQPGSQGASYVDAEAVAAESAPEDDPALDRVINIEAWSFLGDDAKAALVSELRAEAGEHGAADDEYVMCYSRVDRDGDVYTVWASCPIDRQFYRIVCDVPSMSFDVEPCEMPDGLPEINYDRLEVAEEEEAGRQEAAEEERAAAEETGSGADRQDGGSDAGAPSAASTQGGIPLSDDAGLASCLSQGAAMTAADTLCAGARSSYGFDADPAASVVLPSTASVSGDGSCTFDCVLVDASGAQLALRVDYDAATGRFAGTRI